MTTGAVIQLSYGGLILIMYVLYTKQRRCPHSIGGSHKYVTINGTISDHASHIAIITCKVRWGNFKSRAIHITNSREGAREEKNTSIMLTESVCPSLKVTSVIISRGCLDEVSYSKDDSCRELQVS